METSERGVWHPVEGHEGCYEVWVGEDEGSGVIRSLARRSRR